MSTTDPTTSPACDRARWGFGYWCVVCGRFLPEDGSGVVQHDDVVHPLGMAFDDEDNPQ